MVNTRSFSIPRKDGVIIIVHIGFYKHIDVCPCLRHRFVVFDDVKIVDQLADVFSMVASRLLLTSEVGSCHQGPLLPTCRNSLQAL